MNINQLLESVNTCQNLCKTVKQDIDGFEEKLKAVDIALTMSLGKFQLVQSSHDQKTKLAEAAHSQCEKEYKRREEMAKRAEADFKSALQNQQTKETILSLSALSK